MLQLTVQNGAKLLPDVPKGTGGTKSKSNVVETGAIRKLGSGLFAFYSNYGAVLYRL